MSSSVLIAIVAVAAVALLGLLMRRASVATPGTAPPPAPQLEAEEDAEDDASDESVAVTSDGWSFVPVGDRDKVQLVPPRVPDELAVATGRPNLEQLGRGDLIASRVVRGAPDHDPWRLEALGRDHEYRAWRFETEEAAQAALALVAARVVRIPRDPDGEPVPVGEAEFAAARQREQEIEAELAMSSDESAPLEEPRGEPGREPLR